MHLPLLPTLSLSLLTYLNLTSAQSPPTTSHSNSNITHLTAPALITSQNRTKIQCWRLKTPFSTSTTPGTIGAQALTISNVTNLAYTILPPRYNGGRHTAPVPQIVHFVSGLAHITLPDTDDADADADQELYIVGGAGGLVFATDTGGTGHVTRYPSDEVTVGIVAPFEGGRVPEYEVVREGACGGLQTFV